MTISHPAASPTIIILFYSFVREFAACIAQPEASVCLTLTQRQNTLNIYHKGFLMVFCLGGWWAGWQEGREVWKTRKHEQKERMCKGKWELVPVVGPQ